MFNLSRTITDITFESNAHIDLGNRLQEIGGRILLIGASDNKDKDSINELKKQLTGFNLTYIQCDQSDNFINKDYLEELQLRAENFNISSVISIGDFNQRMSGRFISQRLSLNYFELPTVAYNPYMLIPASIYSNRVGDNFDILNMNYDSINSIHIDKNFIRKMNDVEINLTGLSILFDLAQLFINPGNNFVAVTESKNLFTRLITDLENRTINLDSLLKYGITASFYHESSTDTELDLSIYSWLAGFRFKFNPKIMMAKLLPWLLDSNSENLLSGRVREFLNSSNITLRLVDLGFSIKQLTSICSNRSNIIKIVEKAF